MLHSAASLCLTLLLGGTGGFLVAAAGIPGGWIIGAIAASFAACALKAPLKMPRLLRSIAMGFAGMTIGASIDRELFAAAAVIPWSLLAMFVLLAVFGWLTYLIHRHGYGASGATAISCAWPGNVLLAFAGAEAMRADMERVAVVQLVRVVLLMGALPLTIGAFHSAEAGPDVTLTGDFWIAAVIALLCTAAALRARLTGGEMFFSAIAVGALSAGGVLRFEMPGEALAALQVLVGVYIGLSLAACSRAAFLAALAPSLIGAVLAVVLTLGGAFALEGLLGVPAAALALAFAPGGAEAMILLSALFDADPGFVGIHHTLRLIVLTLLFPVMLRGFAGSYHSTGRR